MQNSITRLRMWAILAVLMIHSTGTFLYKPMGADWMVGNVLDSISRFCVPLFLMISGALLLSKEEEPLVFFKKRASKIIIPFFVWSLFYYVEQKEFIWEKLSLKEFIKMLISADIKFHLWYFYLLIPLYILTPLLRKIVITMDSKSLIYYILFFVGIDNLTFILKAYLHIEPKSYLTEVFAYISYFLIGYLIHRNKILEDYKKQTYFAGIAMLIVIIAGTYFAMDIQGKYDNIFYRYTSLPVFIYTIAVMVFLSNREREISKLTNTIATYSFGIYLIHPFFMTHIKKFLIEHDLDTIPQITAVFFGSLVLSYIAVFILSKIPIIKKTI